MDLNELLADIPSEGEAFGKKDERVKETPAESPADNKPTEQAPSPAGAETAPSLDESNKQDESNDVPFHKHPRWQKMREENEALRSRLEELNSSVGQIKETFSQQHQSSVEIPAWFSKLYGENVEAWDAYQDHVKAEREAIKTELFKEQQAQQAKYQEEQKRWHDWVDTSIEKIENQFQADLSNEKDREKFLAFVHKYKPTDDHGNIDLVKGWELYSERQPKEDPARARARKEAADRVMSDSKPAEKPAKDFYTNLDVKKWSWFS